MADQKRIVLRALHATPTTIIMRPLPVADPASNIVYLYAREPTAGNVRLRSTSAPDATFRTPIINTAPSVLVYLYEGESTPANVRLRNPNVADQEEAGGSVTASLAVTEQSDGLSAAAAIAIAAIAAITEASDALTSAARVDLKAASTHSEAPDALTASSAVQVKANLSVTEASDATSAMAVIVRRRKSYARRRRPPFQNWG